MINKSCLFLLIGLNLAVSVIILGINFFIYQYPGNNYFPEDVVILATIVFLIYLGLQLSFGKNHRISCSGLELLYLFGVMSLIALATNAVQLTPFTPIDSQIISLESYFNIDMKTIITWTSKHYYLRYFLVLIYNSLPYQMIFIPLLVIAAGKFHLLRDYYFLLLFTTLIGFSFYYFFPSNAPASMIKSPLFLPEQLATGLKFNQIHHYIKPTTIEGGLIALPSFHCIWALLCINLLKEWPFLYFFFIVINSILIMSCVLLGWHYPIDILAAVILTALGFYCLRVCKKMGSVPYYPSL